MHFVVGSFADHFSTTSKIKQSTIRKMIRDPQKLSMIRKKDP